MVLLFGPCPRCLFYSEVNGKQTWMVFRTSTGTPQVGLTFFFFLYSVCLCFHIHADLPKGFLSMYLHIHNNHPATSISYQVLLDRLKQPSDRRVIGGYDHQGWTNYQSLCKEASGEQKQSQPAVTVMSKCFQWGNNWIQVQVHSFEGGQPSANPLQLGLRQGDLSFLTSPRVI